MECHYDDFGCAVYDHPDEAPEDCCDDCCVAVKYFEEECKQDGEDT